ncbi:hypothetical protein CAI16_15650 [Virgibacillus dokdonensis]|uniref:Uncharacterized protein n=1 Tax=Virgibacillus dokdonensis TaxID=302167 RepID=A0A3E0WJG6_9BACI|nr:efflux RND transporter periplasmic adaptor subunit [Virgibacillus dokdonensis]RFA33130.1 hypothetical protein CAI16_15650 [Virgibacillus dokdonensis]
MRKRKVIISVVIICLVALVLFIGIVQSTGANNPPKVVTETLSKRTIQPSVILPGTIGATNVQRLFYQSEYGSQYELLVEKDQHIDKGTPLIRYFSEETDNELDQLEIQIEAGYLQINQIETQEGQLKENKEKMKKELSEEEAESNYKEEESQLYYNKRIANLDLKTLLLQQEELKKKKEGIIFNSEFDGVVLQANNSSGISEEPLVELAALNHLQVYGKISEYDSLILTEGMSVEITSDSIPETTWHGAVKEIGYLPDNQDTPDQKGFSQYPITFSIEDGDLSMLKPGYQMVIRVMLDNKDTLAIDEAAIHQEVESNYVYVYENGTAYKKEVEVGFSANSLVEVINGVNENDEIIIQSDQELLDGIKVELHD